MNCWLVRQVSSLEGDLPWDAVRVEQADGTKVTFTIGEHVRLTGICLPKNVPFVIEDIKEIKDQPVVVIRYGGIKTRADPFELRKLSPLEQLAAQSTDETKESPGRTS